MNAAACGAAGRRPMRVGEVESIRPPVANSAGLGRTACSRLQPERHFQWPNLPPACSRWSACLERKSLSPTTAAAAVSAGGPACRTAGLWPARTRRNPPFRGGGAPVRASFISVIGMMKELSRRKLLDRHRPFQSRGDAACDEADGIEKFKKLLDSFSGGNPSRRTSFPWIPPGGLRPPAGTVRSSIAAHLASRLSKSPPRGVAALPGWPETGW